MVRRGDADQETLATHWATIYQEYSLLVGDSANKVAISTAFEIEALTCRIQSIYEALDILRVYRVDELVEMLQKEGFRFPFNDDDLEEYHNDLNRTATRAKTLVVELNQKKALQKKQQDQGDQNNITRAHFETWLAVLSKFMGHSLDEEKLKVARWATILKLYTAHCEQLKAKADEKRPNR